MEEIESIIKKQAALNRVRYGEANPKAVMGKILSMVPEARKDPGKIAAIVQGITEEVNGMPLDEVTALCEGAEKREKTERTQELSVRDPPENVVMRFAPNPNGPPTLGSARGIVVNSILARKYNGKFILRFDDTDAKNKPPLPMAYDQYVEDCKWLSAGPDEVYRASDRIDIYYEYAAKLIEMGKAYVCLCPQADFKALKDAKKPCPHRETSPAENLEKWNAMLEGKYKEGEVTLRIKTDITHKDPAMRDYAAFRIIDASHPLTGTRYRVWPMLDFESAIEDHLLGITLIIRGIDLMDSEGRQKYIYGYLGWEYPRTLHWGRVKLEEFGKFSTSMLKKGIDEGVYSGWDDPRLPTLMAMRRRGILPETLRNVMVSLGLGENPVSLSLETIFAENRKNLDPQVNRYFCVISPVKVTVKGAPEKGVKMPLHPGFRDRGSREYMIRPEQDTVTLHVSGEDALSMSPGEEVRLMNLYNVIIEKAGPDGVEASYVDSKRLDVKKVQWITGGVGATIVYPDETRDCLCERYCRDLETGDIVQFERIGFARLDGREDSGGSRADGRLVFYFGHR